MARLWGRIIVRHRIDRSETVSCAPDGVADALRELCQIFDIPMPIWLDKHTREFESFRQTSFLPEHFMEDVPFAKFEIEYLDDTGKKRKSSDPRNQFDGF